LGRVRIKAKPFNGLVGGGMNADVLHFSDEVEGVATMFTFAETVEDIFAGADAELRRVAAFMNGTWAGQTIATAFELVEEAIMFQDFLHGDGRFDSLEVNELGFGHNITFGLDVTNGAVQELNRIQ
jgi:hypothetical protein